MSDDFKMLVLLSRSLIRPTLLGSFVGIMLNLVGIQICESYYVSVLGLADEGSFGRVIHVLAHGLFEGGFLGLVTGLAHIFILRSRWVDLSTRRELINASIKRLLVFGAIGSTVGVLIAIGSYLDVRQGIPIWIATENARYLWVGGAINGFYLGTLLNLVWLVRTRKRTTSKVDSGVGAEGSAF